METGKQPYCTFIVRMINVSPLADQYIFRTLFTLQFFDIIIMTEDVENPPKRVEK